MGRMYMSGTPLISDAVDHSADSSSLSPLLHHALEQELADDLYPLLPKKHRAMDALLLDFERSLLHIELDWQDNPDRCTQCARHVAGMLSGLRSGTWRLCKVSIGVDLPVPDSEWQDWQSDYLVYTDSLVALAARWDTFCEQCALDVSRLFDLAATCGGSVLRWSLGEVQRFGRLVFSENGLPPPRCPDAVWYQWFRESVDTTKVVTTKTNLDRIAAPSYARNLVGRLMNLQTREHDAGCHSKQSTALTVIGSGVGCKEFGSPPKQSIGGEIQSSRCARLEAPLHVPQLIQSSRGCLPAAANAVQSSGAEFASGTAPARQPRGDTSDVRGVPLLGKDKLQTHQFAERQCIAGEQAHQKSEAAATCASPASSPQHPPLDPMPRSASGKAAATRNRPMRLASMPKSVAELGTPPAKAGTRRASSHPVLPPPSQFCSEVLPRPARRRITLSSVTDAEPSQQLRRPASAGVPLLRIPSLAAATLSVPADLPHVFPPSLAPVSRSDAIATGVVSSLASERCDAKTVSKNSRQDMLGITDASITRPASQTVEADMADEPIRTALFADDQKQTQFVVAATEHPRVPHTQAAQAHGDASGGAVARSISPATSAVSVRASPRSCSVLTESTWADSSVDLRWNVVEDGEPQGISHDMARHVHTGTIESNFASADWTFSGRLSPAANAPSGSKPICGTHANRFYSDAPELQSTGFRETCIGSLRDAARWIDGAAHAGADGSFGPQVPVLSQHKLPAEHVDLGTQTKCRDTMHGRLSPSTPGVHVSDLPSPASDNNATNSMLTVVRNAPREAKVRTDQCPNFRRWVRSEQFLDGDSEKDANRSDVVASNEAATPAVTTHFTETASAPVVGRSSAVNHCVSTATPNGCIKRRWTRSTSAAPPREVLASRSNFPRPRREAVASITRDTVVTQDAASWHVTHRCPVETTCLAAPAAMLRGQSVASGLSAEQQTSMEALTPDLSSQMGALRGPSSAQPASSQVARKRLPGRRRRVRRDVARGPGYVNGGGRPNSEGSIPVHDANLRTDIDIREDVAQQAHTLIEGGVVPSLTVGRNKNACERHSTRRSRTEAADTQMPIHDSSPHGHCAESSSKLGSSSDVRFRSAPHSPSASACKMDASTRCPLGATANAPLRQAAGVCPPAEASWLQGNLPAPPRNRGFRTDIGLASPGATESFDSLVRKIRDLDNFVGGFCKANDRKPSWMHSHMNYMQPIAQAN